LGAALGGVGQQEFIFYSQTIAKRDCPGLIGNEIVGTAFDEETILTTRFQHATHPVFPFQKLYLEFGGELLNSPSRRQAGNSATHDCDIQRLIFNLGHGHFQIAADEAVELCGGITKGGSKPNELDIEYSSSTPGFSTIDLGKGFPAYLRSLLYALRGCGLPRSLQWVCQRRIEKAK
jgi:hypothetical protein